MIVVHGSDPMLMTRAALQNFGGMKTFVKRGETIMIKPNIGWDRMAEQAANTNPEVVKALVQESFAAGARKVIVTDISCNDPERCFGRSGIAFAAEEAGAVVERPLAARYTEINLGGGILGMQTVYKTFLEVDKVINVPIAKHHSLTGTTLGMKNTYGILGGNRNRLHQDIHQSIADLGNFFRPTLTVLDAIRVLKRNGPQGGNLADVEIKNMLVMSTDPVALDAYGAETFFSITKDKLPYLALSEKSGLGVADYRTLPMTEFTA
jgi:uncharacterized protein (DUF362 family)